MESATQKRPVSKFVAKMVEEEQERAKTLLSSFLDSYRHPISQAIEVIQNIQPRIQQAMEIAQQHFKAIEQALKTYQNWIKIMREAYDRFVNFFKLVRWSNFFKNIWQHVQDFVVSFLLAEYHQLHRARDGTEEDIFTLSHAYPIEFRRFCKITGHNQSKSARIEFATHFFEALDQADKRYPLDEDDLLHTLQRFFFRLGLILRDLLRKAYREFQKTFAREKNAEECTVCYLDKKYLLIPSLSALTDISEPTLRRYASQGKFGAIKLPYISARSGHKNMAWHFLYSPQLTSKLKAHAVKNKRQRTQLFTRKQVASVLGIHVDTLRNWERKGLVNTLRESGVVWYHKSQMPHLLEILKQNNSPRHQALMAQR